MKKTVTATWKKHDTYVKILTTSRWEILKSLIRGRAGIQWERPYDAKRKGIYVKGKKL